MKRKKIETFIKSWGVHVLVLPLLIIFGAVYASQDSIVSEAKKKQREEVVVEEVKGSSSKSLVEAEKPKPKVTTKVTRTVITRKVPGESPVVVEDTVVVDMSAPAPEENKAEEPVVEEPEVATVTLLITGLDAFEIELLGDDTALSILERASGEHGFALDVTIDPVWGAFINGINGVASADPFYWFLYHNGVESYEGAGILKVFEGDKIEWRYKSWLE